MPLTTGARLGAYEILCPLGAGGMGEVYRARDTNLARDVAVKILPDSLMHDADRVARFRREAQLLASLNEPHIAHVYGFEEAGGIRALVMELVEGPTLADRIAQGPIPLDEALAIAAQVADALETAHEQGIVHRDLKPANIKIRPDDTVKVLDFGLAKVFEPAAAAASSAAMSPTLSIHATHAGLILGTASYMAPEQARGKTVDRRADIWSFGVVLFEMISGRRLFGGEEPTDVIAAVLTREPDWGALPADAPAPLLRLLRRCLERDPRRRLQAIGDARLEIEDLAAGRPADVGGAAPAPRRAAWLQAAPWIAAAAAAAIAIVTVVLSLRTPPAADVARLEVDLPPDVELFSITNGAPITLAPDGRSLAFVGIKAASRLAFLRSFADGQTRALAGTDLAMTAVFSPDSTMLAVLVSDGTLRRISLKDDHVETVLRGFDYNSGAAYGPDGRIVFTRDRMLWQLPGAGGEPTKLLTLDAARHEANQQWPAFLPGGRVLLFTSYVAGNLDAPRIEALTLADGRRRTIVERAAYPMYAPTGHLIFLRDGGLFAAPFDARRLETTGAAAHVVDQVGVSGSGAPMAAISQTGTLVYAPGAATSAGRLVWVSRGGAETPITETPRNYASPHLAPDGRRIAVVGDANTLWIQDTTRPVFTRLTAGDLPANYPVWTRDGKRIFYRSSDAMHWIEADGSGRTGAIAGTSQLDYPSSVSPDDKTLLFLHVSPDSGGDLYVLSLEGEPNPRPFVRTAAYEGGPQFSPDGRWVAYASNDSGQFQIYVRPYPGPDRRVQVSTDGGSYPLWSRTGTEIFYRNGNRMMAVDVATGALDADPTVSAPKMLFEARYAFVGNTVPAYDVSADGQRFVVVKQESTANRLNVVLNWFSELKSRAPIR